MTTSGTGTGGSVPRGSVSWAWCALRGQLSPWAGAVARAMPAPGCAWPLAVPVPVPSCAVPAPGCAGLAPWQGLLQPAQQCQGSSQSSWSCRLCACPTLVAPRRCDPQPRLQQGVPVASLWVGRPSMARALTAACKSSQHSKHNW